MDDKLDAPHSQELVRPSGSREVASQVLSNVRIGSGDVNVVGRDLVQIHNHHVHHHHYAAESPAKPPILDKVPNLRDIHIETLGKATEGTGDWIYVWNEFTIWLASDGYIRILWGSGMPGAGKSVLASLAINAVEAHAKAATTPVCVGFLYIRYSDNGKLTVRDLLEILVKQTIERHPAALPLCNEVYVRHAREKTEPSTKELLGLLKRFTSELKASTFYFLDALDEAPADIRIDLLESLTTLNVKLFITSRPLNGLEARFPNTHRFPICAQDRDLDVHISKEISRSMELQAILATSSPGLGGRITLTIKRNCSGMFLHASLPLKALRECTSRHELEKTLEEFPPQIADVYSQTWDRIINQSLGKTMLAMNVLTWVLYATRSLSIEELRHAVATCPDTHIFEPRRLVTAETLVGVCGGLLAIEKETKQVRLVHYTAKDVLQTLLVKVVPFPHSLLAAICTVCLSGCGFQHSTLASKEDLDTALKSAPLLEYAYYAWADHARGSLLDEATKHRLTDFAQGCQAFPILPYKYGTFGLFGPLHVLAYFDLPVSLLGSPYLRNPNLTAQVEGLTPLHLACIGNSPLAVKELLSLSRVLVNVADKNGWTPLIWASDLGHEHVVKVLLSHPHIKVNQAGEGGATALHRSSQAGHTATVELLLADPKINVNQRLSVEHDATPLILASQFGKTDVVNLLLAHPKINVNLVDKARGWSALMYAVTRPAVVKALLAHPQIDVNQRDREGRTALHLAIRYKRKEVEGILRVHSQRVGSNATQANPSHTAGQSSISRLIDDFSRLGSSLW
ncbi:hypothetical protein BKA70DRAFT_56204 [Coprinopsis sp. MPI-PUGE-AT-0042]|nr:hypothetical protein BKA70DRAFT_56204 [Coprinopsis sp. MPI-PUGE-AT-0042]